MKRTLGVLLIALGGVLLARCSSLPPWQSVPSGQQAEYGRIETNDDLIQFLAFSDAPDISAIAVQNKAYSSPPRYAILLDGSARDAMRTAFEKYEKWKDIARDNHTDITKAITTLELQQMYYLDGAWHDAGDRELSLIFNSATDDNGAQGFSLALRPSPLHWRAFYRVYGRESLVLSDDQVKPFSDLLSESAVEGGYQKAKKKQDAIDMFH